CATDAEWGLVGTVSRFDVW
nr:immunoglobulin heavy chain junction region [Macaca mulatta]MOX66580.1 immunoglobulin heavy chain junction region [Macaca mulatta]